MVFLLDKRFSWRRVNDGDAQTWNRLHIYRRSCCTLLGADPDTEVCGYKSVNADLDRLKKPISATAPLGEAPLRSRGHSDPRHKRVEHIFLQPHHRHEHIRHTAV